MTATLEHPRYQFDRWVAAGGMGEVWQATDTLLDREVAVKVLRPELAQDPVLRARFAAEARHAGALQHPHVASVLDYGELAAPGRPPLPFLVMELVDGQPLSAMLAGGRPLAPESAAELIAQAAEGIEAAHAMGIVHRDVKPGNLLVTADGQVKVTDFGVARAAHAASLTMTGHLIGTPNYLPPEQAEGRSATAVSDVYSLGIVLYECLTGRKPFAAETPVATAVMQIRDPLPPFPLPVPERLRRITEIATAKDPAARFRSAGAMAAALRDESPATRSYLVPPSTSGATAADPLAPRRDQAIAGPMGARRLLVGLVTLLLVSVGVWATTASTDEPPAPPTADASSEDGGDAIRVRAGQYVGLDVAVAMRRLKELGLRPRLADERRANPGQQERGTVAAITPTGLLDPGTRVELTLWSQPPPPVVPSTDPGVPGDTERSGPGTGGAENQGGSPAGRRGSSSSGDGGDGSPGNGPGAGGNSQNNGQSNGQGNGQSNGQGPGSSNAGGNGKGNSSSNAGGNGKGNSGGNGGGNGKGNSGGNGGGNGGGSAKAGKGGKR